MKYGMPFVGDDRWPNEWGYDEESEPYIWGGKVVPSFEFTATEAWTLPFPMASKVLNAGDTLTIEYNSVLMSDD